MSAAAEITPHILASHEPSHRLLLHNYPDGTNAQALGTIAWYLPTTAGR
jgi:hypothetical protein